MSYTNQGSPATISDFRLDKYEVTVGRFRKFVSVWLAGWRPAPGSGKHTHLNNGSGLNGDEAGWDPSWETLGIIQEKPSFPPTLDAWNETLACTLPLPSRSTWTPAVGDHENLPISCENFLEGYAFCIWDGGFLPSEAEWNYAASGGAEQRVYPWGPQMPSAALAVYSQCVLGSPGCSTDLQQARVGSLAAGNGRYGQADLGGNMMERVLDEADDYQTPCTDCASLNYRFPRQQMTAMSVRGGSFIYDASYLFSSARFVSWFSDRDEYLGIRCARSPLPR